MVRFIAFIVIAVLLAFLVETYTDFDVGVTDFLDWLVHNGVSGAYALASNAISIVVGAVFGD